MKNIKAFRMHMIKGSQPSQGLKAQMQKEGYKFCKTSTPWFLVLTSFDTIQFGSRIGSTFVLCL